MHQWKRYPLMRLGAGLTALVLAAVTLAAVPMRSAFAANPSITWALEEVYVEADGTKVERGYIGDVRLESRTKGSIITTTIEYPDRVEVVRVDRTSPYFTVSVNGQETLYDRRTMGKYMELPSPDPMAFPRNPSHGVQLRVGSMTDQMRQVPGITPTAVPPSAFFGYPYYGKFIGSAVRYSPIYVSARAEENYDYYFTSYRSWNVVVYTLFSVVLGWVGLSWNSLMAIVASVVATVDGALRFIQDVVIGQDTYRLDWTRYVTINQDPNGGIWYWAGKTQYKSITWSVDGAVDKLESESKHHDFDNVSLLMQTAIDNYLRHLGYY